MEYVRLNDGNMIPAIGFGVFTIPNDGPTYEAARGRPFPDSRHPGVTAERKYL